MIFSKIHTFSPDILLITLLVLIASCSQKIEEEKKQIGKNVYPVKHPIIEFNPKKYTCYKINKEIIIDGIINEDIWEEAVWSDEFQDIEGNSKPTPYQSTKMKMLWDDKHLYIAALLEEEHIWGTLKQRDTIIFQDNDFEVFIEPNGDTHNYYEIEVNVLNTIFDLMLVKPYRDGGPLIIPWDAPEMKSAIKINGTLNDNRDTDKSWTVEMAIPWKYINEQKSKNLTPELGEIWRINFSRVQYQLDTVGFGYKRVIKPNGKVKGPDNWVWSPQGIVNMHYPEMWGYLILTEKGKEISFPTEIENIKWGLRKLYYNQNRFVREKGFYSNNSKELGADSIKELAIKEYIKILLTNRGYEITYPTSDQKSQVFISNDGRTSVINLKKDY